MAETSTAASNAASAIPQTYPLDPAAAADGAAAGCFIQGAATQHTNFVDPSTFLNQPPHPSIMQFQSHFQHQHQYHQTFHYQHQQHQGQQVPAYQKHRTFSTSATSAILPIHCPSSATATNTAPFFFINMSDPLDLNTYATAGVSGDATGYAISGGEEVMSSPAIDSPTVQHQQAHSLPMSPYGGPDSPRTLPHRDLLSSSSSENMEIGPQEAAPAARTDAASSTTTIATGDDIPALPVVKARQTLPKPVANFLRKWLLEHAAHPYPNEQEKKMLREKTGLNMLQLSNSMINIIVFFSMFLVSERKFGDLL